MNEQTAAEDRIADIATRNALEAIQRYITATHADAQAQLRIVRENLAKLSHPSAAQRYAEGVAQGRVDGLSDALAEVRYAISALCV